ncbi:hypothetical protein DAPPUDRAFT_302930 [Daphnia pulex]|uniref:Uncharacterized protein n=1 Tax=Daphnia pulex TaxID=6669 RepID=E9HQ39_DAPPU|nr:hypothetical protein DAPPUDRAFT_302930 [Daphnia pulex]|eukprot:EFX66148.1 hypothetical protein DAPPUDRAFT_302930 [Daphnia pulex]
MITTVNSRKKGNGQLFFTLTLITIQTPVELLGPFWFNKTTRQTVAKKLKVMVAVSVSFSTSIVARHGSVKLRNL